MSKQFLKKSLEPEEILAVSRLMETGEGKAFVKLLTAERDRVRKGHEEKPVISDDLKKDFRSELGAIGKLNWALGQVAEAKAYLQQPNERSNDET